MTGPKSQKAAAIDQDTATLTNTNSCPDFVLKKLAEVIAALSHV